MNWDAFKSYDLGYRSAFETLNNQLFERYIRRTYGSSVVRFRVINGAGGDGGVEAYAEINGGEIIAIQSKWFRNALDTGEIGQIKNSILTAKRVRPQIKKYVICIPHDVSSQKIGRGKTVTVNHEEKKINDLIDEIYQLHPDLNLIWWFDNELLNEIQQSDNEGVRKYWFDRQIISLPYLKDQFAIQKQNNWLKERYIPELHGLGIIYTQYQKMILAKEYRDKLFEKLQEKLNMLTHCMELIAQFLATNAYPTYIKTDLDKISGNLKAFVEEISGFQDDILKGNERFKVKPLSEEGIWPATIELEKIRPSHTQKTILPRLIKCLRDIHTNDLPNYIIDLNIHLREVIKLVRGGAGTGKTHGLANCVEKHLEHDMPALIIQAKNTPCSNWTEILTHALELPGWNKNEICSALESLAISRDVGKAATLAVGEELEEPVSKVLICIDGLEEQTGKENDWCSRISETTVLSEKYPRLRFLFSARDYFKRHCIAPNIKIWEEINLPREGDVPVWEVAKSYFDQYGIKLENLSLIKGINNLLALRLFCEEYSGIEITSATHIVTATRDLLRLKVDRINREFLATLQQGKSVTQQPVFEALLMIAELYYQSQEIEHNALRSAIHKKVGEILSVSEVDIMLDFFVRHGILIRISREDDSLVLPKTNQYYRITYQSIIEHILSEQIYQDIKAAKIGAIPDILHKGIVQPLDVTLPTYQPPATPPNRRIIQSIINRLFVETGRLIGEDGFLVEGFSEQDILEMQFEAISVAPFERAFPYKGYIDQMFFEGGKSQFTVLKLLIIPSASHAGSAFGSEYINDILIKQSSSFERDKLWSGLDKFEAHRKKEVHYKNPVKEALNEFGTSGLMLSDFEEYNERPLLYAWALSNIDQALRNSLRVALTGWAIKNPEEFLKLLDKIFGCNDPQIQEDLASVMLGVAGHVNDSSQLKSLADWTLKNIFENKETHRNVVVRQGFRAVVEKAFIRGSIFESDVRRSRPVSVTHVTVLDLEINSISEPDGETYPIEHDLAWYVIKNAYQNFLEYPSKRGDGVEDNDCSEAKTLLNLYREKYKTPDMYAHSWGIAAAIGYIRNQLGLTREDGSGYTDESHGSKSKIFTYEEKYVWLAVHYLQGYLSDYIPIDNDREKREWIKDYSQINDMPNPGEEVVSRRKIDSSIREDKYWVIKEDLAPVIDVTVNIESNIKAWVNEEPDLHLDNWLRFNEKDFPEFGTGKKWLALRNYTALNEPSKVGFTHMVASSCLIRIEDFEKLKTVIENKPERQLHFITNLDGLMTSPDTTTYANPSDIVWMDWIEENSDGETVYLGGNESKLFYTVTELTQGTVEGEKYYKLPSKLIRRLLNIQSFSNSVLEDDKGQVVSFLHRISEGSYNDTQELLLVDAELLDEKLQKQGLKIFWLVDHFKQKNPLNKSLDKVAHTQKTRKYLVWREGDIFQNKKFWDEYYSNQRGEKRKEKAFKSYEKK